MLWPKISHIFGTERFTDFTLGIRVEYDDPHHRHARGDLKGQRSKVITSRLLYDACLPITRQRKVAQAPKLEGRLFLPRVTLHTSSKVKRSKVKVTSPLWVAVQVTTCGMGILLRPHYRPHSLFGAWALWGLVTLTYDLSTQSDSAVGYWIGSVPEAISVLEM